MSAAGHGTRGLFARTEALVAVGLLLPLVTSAWLGPPPLRWRLLALAPLLAAVTALFAWGGAKSLADERTAELRSLVGKLITAQEEERKRVARELHDETTQTLSALAMQIDVAPAGDPRTRGELRGLATRALDGVHRIIRDLRPSMLDDLGLVPALRGYVEKSVAPRGLSVRMEVDGLPERLPRDSETLLYRIAQEALTNVVRHARAENVLVQMARKNGTLAIEIEDDGCGFTPSSVATPADSGRGLGLLGMRERVELLGGTLEVDSAPGEGTRIAVEVPCPSAS